MGKESSIKSMAILVIIASIIYASMLETVKDNFENNKKIIEANMQEELEVIIEEYQFKMLEDEISYLVTSGLDKIFTFAVEVEND